MSCNTGAQPGGQTGCVGTIDIGTYIKNTDRRVYLIACSKNKSLIHDLIIDVLINFHKLPVFFKILYFILLLFPYKNFH